MIANLIMYNRPELADAHNQYWALIRQHLATAGIDSPVHLSQNSAQNSDEFSVWKDPHLVLSQTCGMPYRKFLHGEVKLVGTPDFAIDGCPPGYYRSEVIVHASDQRTNLNAFRSDVFAFNQKISQSGYAAMYTHTTAHDFWFDNKIEVGSHLEAARAVAEKRAAIASIDAVTWRLIKNYEPFATNLKVIARTDPTPGLPYITSRDQNPKPIFAAIKQAISELSHHTRNALGIVDLIEIPAEKYLAVPDPIG